MSHSVEVKFQCVCICVQQTLFQMSCGVKYYVSTGLSIWEAMTGRTGKMRPFTASDCGQGEKQDTGAGGTAAQCYTPA